MLTIKTPEQHQWRYYGVLLLTWNKFYTLVYRFHH